MKNMNVHLSKDLISKYGIKNFPVRKGDMVRIVRGDAEKDEKLNIVGKEGKVIKIMTDKGKVVVENINIAKSDGKMKPRKLDPSALVLTKIVLEDKKRKERLTKLASLRNKVVEEEPEPEQAVKEAAEEKKEEKVPEITDGGKQAEEGEEDKDE
ncbi:MAG: 50S ribosomal protein L24 [Candidatus Thermoplasmatota archaeon]|jgi:large subunit ribosomal protein L24|nr:50S ribosomal protein L24 [Candidatus Thermoplasmatota archaeon]